MTISDVSYGHRPIPAAPLALNVRSRVLHDLNHLSERCNTDQIILKRYFASVDEAIDWLRRQGRLCLSKCHWCLGG